MAHKIGSYKLRILYGAECRTDINGDLDRLQDVEMRIDGKSYVVRTETKGTVGKVFHARGVALPPTLRPAQAS